MPYPIEFSPEVGYNIYALVINMIPILMGT